MALINDIGWAAQHKSGELPADSTLAQRPASVRCDSVHSDFSQKPTNNGKPWVNRPAVQIQERRKPEPKRYDDGLDIDWTSVWIVLIAIAVVWALFGDTLGGQW